MVLITIVTGAHKPTFNYGAPHYTTLTYRMPPDWIIVCFFSPGTPAAEKKMAV